MTDLKKFYVSIPAKYTEYAMVEAPDAEQALEKFKGLVTNGETELDFAGWDGFAEVREVTHMN